MEGGWKRYLLPGLGVIALLVLFANRPKGRGQQAFQQDLSAGQQVADALSMEEFKKQSAYTDALRGLDLEERAMSLGLAQQASALQFERYAAEARLLQIPLGCPPNTKAIRNSETGSVQCVKSNVHHGFLGELGRSAEKAARPFVKAKVLTWL